MLPRSTKHKPSVPPIGGPGVTLIAFLSMGGAWGGACGTQPPTAPPAVVRQSLPPAPAPPRPTTTAPSPARAIAQAGPSGPVLLSSVDLDSILDKMWAAAHVTPAPISDDAEFLRRLTLDVVGRIPTLAEAEQFAASTETDKRTRLVDTLLGSAEYADHWADVYVDLFVGRQFRKPNLEKRLDPRSYFVGAFRENRRFDQVARELLTFTGEILPNGPGVFLASHLKGGGPELAASVTARLFMGVQIQCAQCHDHPYDARYKQEDFYGLVAYFARTKDRQQKREPSPPASATDRIQDSNARPDDKIYLVFDKPRGQAKFRRAGAQTDTVVPPRFFGRAIAPLADESPRETLARAVVGSDLFAKTMVDRTWAQLFGRAIVEPWDDLGGEKDPRHPPLLNRLADDFRASGFDVKHLLRTILLSRAYGLTSRVSAPERAAAPDAVADAPISVAVSVPAPDPAAVFARAAVRRLTPEQLFRSLLIATGSDRMERGGAEVMDKKIARLLRECLFVFGDDEAAEVNTFNGNVPQALLLWNGEIVNQGAKARPGGTLAAILDENPSPEARLQKMFLAAYTRPCTEAERDRLLPALRGQKAARAAYEDLFFAMLTSSEMLTIH